jgi:hypothetical protein
MTMKYNILICILLAPFFWATHAQNRWHINQEGSITWNIDSRLPHYDHIEMSGEQISVVLRVRGESGQRICVGAKFCLAHAQDNS